MKPCYAAQMQKRPLRILGVVRISKLTDESTSIERQRAQIILAAAALGGEIVGWAEDPDVSATNIGPFERKRLGHWLTDRTDDFDVIIVFKWDRIARGSQDTRQLLLYCTDHKKRIMSALEPMIDFDPLDENPIRRICCDMFISVVSIFAEMETKQMSVRWKDTKAFLANSNYWLGGSPPYFCTATKGQLPDAQTKGIILSLNPETVPHAMLIVNGIIAGVPYTHIAKQLNEEGVLPPTEYKRKKQGKPYDPEARWTAVSVREVAETRMLIGELVHKGEVVRDAEGKARIYVKPLLSRARFSLLRTKMAAKTVGREYSNETQLSGAVECLECGSPLYMRISEQKGVVYRHYICSNPRKVAAGRTRTKCSSGYRCFQAEQFHALLDDRIAHELASFELYEDLYVEGVGSHEEISNVKDALMVTTRKLLDGDFRTEFMQRALSEQQAHLEARLIELELQGVVEARWERRPTGKTLSDEWGTANWQRRRELLHMAGITVRAHPATQEMEIVLAEDTPQRLADYAAGRPLPPVRKSPPTARVKADQAARRKLIDGTSS